MAKSPKNTNDATAKPAAGAVTITYVGPADAESPRYGQLVPGRSYQESDPEFAAYLTTQHPDHWTGT